MNKRFQVFISSTYDDLKAERKAVEGTILRAGDIPVGMEAFPAADEEQFEFIKSVIDGSDFYVLVVAGRYGSLDSDGLSYTEKEYHYAVSIGIPVLFLLHDDRGNIPASKTESLTTSKKKLEQFIRQASAGRIRKDWNTIDGLKLAVREALDYAKATKSRPGWVRGDLIATEDVLQELATTQRENKTLRIKLGTIETEISLPDLPSLEQETIVSLEKFSGGYSTSTLRIQGRWIDFFPLFYRTSSIRYDDWNGEDYWRIDEDESRRGFGSAISLSVGSDNPSDTVFSKESFDLLTAYYEEAGLLNKENMGEPFTDLAGKLARRLLIANSSNADVFAIVSETKRPPQDIDDVIPF